MRPLAWMPAAALILPLAHSSPVRADEMPGRRLVLVEALPPRGPVPAAPAPDWLSTPHLQLALADGRSAAAPAATAPTSTGGDFDFGFDEPGSAAKTPTEAERKATERTLRRAQTRRSMLTAHQAFGISALVVLAATLVVGQLDYYDKYQSGNFYGTYQNPHLILAVSDAALFATAGMLALLAPDPYPKKLRFDSAMVHRVAMGVAVAGMIAQMVLGPITASRVGRNDQGDYALAHLVIGYATFAAMGTGVVAYFF